jgi:hypothetical protein
MLLPRSKIRYRVVLGFLSVLSLFATAASYVSYGINAYYFKNQSHWVEYILIVLFGLLSFALIFEFTKLRYFSRRERKNK